MNNNDLASHARLEDVLHSIFCPVSGCWPLHGATWEYYFDADAESHVLEVWPKAVDDPTGRQQDGDQGEVREVYYELAEFDFTELAKVVPLSHFHFSQRRAVFEIGWEEEGRVLELRVHIMPADGADDI